MTDGIKSTDSHAENTGGARPTLSIDHENEPQLEPKGSMEAKKIQDDGDNSDGDGESLVGLASRTMEEAKKRASGDPILGKGVLGDSDTDDGANVDIDEEFDRVMPVGKEDAPSVNYNMTRLSTEWQGKRSWRSRKWNKRRILSRLRASRKMKYRKPHQAVQRA